MCSENITYRPIFGRVLECLTSKIPKPTIEKFENAKYSLNPKIQSIGTKNIMDGAKHF